MAEERLPPPPVLTPPAGWLGILGIKSGGKQPGRVAEGLAPTIEMLPFYRAGARGPLASAVVAAGLNGNVGSANMTVPQGKVWLVDGALALSATLGVTAAVTAFLTINDQGNHAWDAGPPSPKGVTGEVISCGLGPIPRPLIMNSGDFIGIFTTAPAAFTAFNWTLAVWGAQVSA